MQFFGMFICSPAIYLNKKTKSLNQCLDVYSYALGRGASCEVQCRFCLLDTNAAEACILHVGLYASFCSVV